MFQNITEKNYSIGKMSVSKYRIISFVSLFVFIFIYLIANFDPNKSNNGQFHDLLSILNIPFRMIFAIIGPILSFIFFISLFFSFFFEVTKSHYFSQILQYTLISGLISIIFALTLNSRSFLSFAISLSLLKVDVTTSMLIIFAVIGPLIEEVAKALPIYYLSRAMITNRGKSNELRLLDNAKIPVLIGLITGLVFNVLETFWYTFNVSYLFLLYRPNIWYNLSTQIIIRSINPVHFFTAAISGLGISEVLWNNHKKSLGARDYKIGYFYFIFAIFYHGLWNGILVLIDENTVIINFNGIELPIASYIMIFVSIIGLAFIINYANNYTTDLCSFCNQWHSPSITEEEHTNTFSPEIHFLERINRFFRKKKANYRCVSCKSIMDNGVKYCLVCNARPMYACGNCSAPIPVYESKCWRCKKDVKPVFDNVMQYGNSNKDNIYLGILYIMVSSYVGIVLTSMIILINVPKSIDADFLGIKIFYLGLIGSTLLIAIKWINTDEKKAMGISIQRTIIGMLIIEFALLLLILAIFALTITFYLTFLLFMFETVILIYFGITIIFSYKPLFHNMEVI